MASPKLTILPFWTVRRHDLAHVFDWYVTCLAVILPKKMGVERVKGIEPSFSAWEADVLPLNDTRLLRFPRHMFP